MALKLNSFTKRNPGACMHYLAVMNLDGQASSAEMSLPQLRSLFDDFPGGYKQALLLALIRYRLEQDVPVELLNKKVRIA